MLFASRVRDSVVRKWLAAVALLATTAFAVSVAGARDLTAQQRVQRRMSVGAHVASNLSYLIADPIDLVRFGVQSILPVVGPVSLYPMASVHLDRAQWQVSALARIDPSPAPEAVPFYLGAGVSHITWEIRRHGSTM